MPPTAPTSEIAPPGVLGLIGNTPIVEITRLDTGLCRLFVKLENQNPTGSIKDRIALAMIEAAERDGRLKPGATVIEATAGNTGLGLALVAQAKGYRTILVIPDKMAQEKVLHLKALGAEIRITRSDVGKGHPEYYQDIAARLALEIPNSFYVNQFNNPDNPIAHERSTGPEIWEQMGHEVDAVVVGVGSGGTLTGLGRYFARVNPDCELVLADPEGSILASYVNTGKLGTAGSWAVEGIGEDFIPDVCDISFARHAITVTDEESFLVARELVSKEGLLGGSSSGTLIAAALRYCRSQTVPKRVVTFLCDSGNKYLSKMFNDFWMAEQGFLRRPQHGDLRDLISRRHEDSDVVFVGPDDTLLTAFKRMRLAEISQLPVLNAAGAAIGILDESDLLLRVQGSAERFRDPVSTAMNDKLVTVAPTESREKLTEIFDRGHVAIVCEDGRFLGLITRTDLLAQLRRSVK